MAKNIDFENENLGVLESHLIPYSSALDDGDLVEICLQVYAKEEKPLTLKELVKVCHNELKDFVDDGVEDITVAVHRLMNKATLVSPGYIQRRPDANGETTFQITDKGYAYLWDKNLQRHEKNIFDRYGKIISLNKKLNDPDREIEGHDLYALTLLAIQKLNGTAETASDIREVLETWVTPTGINAEIVESEQEKKSPLNRFQRKFHNIFSSHNLLNKEGLIVYNDEGKKTPSWAVTTKGKALLMKRSLKERRNLNLQMQAAAVAHGIRDHLNVLAVVRPYEHLAKTKEEQEAVEKFLGFIATAIERDQKMVQTIQETLTTPTSSKTKRKP